MSYYRLEDDRRFYQDFTGTGNTLNLDHPRVLAAGDGLAALLGDATCMSTGSASTSRPALGRENGEYSQDSAFFDALRQDPALAGTEADCRAVGYRPGRLSARQFSARLGRMERPIPRYVAPVLEGRRRAGRRLASRVAGSSDIFGYRGRRPWASINFITAHDGFTLHDLVSYNDKHNEANGEDNRDGHDANFSWNCGVEGPTDDPEIIALRDRQKRNLLATLLLSLGVPMLLAGDEFGRTQHGNNNAYCQDNEISWLDWEKIRPEDQELRRFVS